MLHFKILFLLATQIAIGMTQTTEMPLKHYVKQPHCCVIDEPMCCATNTTPVGGWICQLFKDECQANEFMIRNPEWGIAGRPHRCWELPGIHPCNPTCQEYNNHNSICEKLDRGPECVCNQEHCLLAEDLCAAYSIICDPKPPPRNNAWHDTPFRFVPNGISNQCKCLPRVTKATRYSSAANFNEYCLRGDVSHISCEKKDVCSRDTELCRLFRDPVQRYFYNCRLKTNYQPTKTEDCIYATINRYHKHVCRRRCPFRDLCLLLNQQCAANECSKSYERCNLDTNGIESNSGSSCCSSSPSRTSCSC